MLCSLLVMSMHDYVLDGVALNILTHTHKHILATPTCISSLTSLEAHSLFNSR